MLYAKRENLDVEVAGAQVFLVDITQGRKRVYEYRQRLYTPMEMGLHQTKTYLDPDGNLYVLRADRSYSKQSPNVFLRLESPIVPVSPAYRLADIAFPTLIRSYMGRLDEGLHFRNGSHLFGATTIRNLNAVLIEEDVNDPDVEQRSLRKLGNDITGYLNPRIASWTDSLYEVLDTKNTRLFARIKLRPQEVALANDVRTMQAAGRKDDEYARKLQMSNRLLLDRLLGPNSDACDIALLSSIDGTDPHLSGQDAQIYQGVTHDRYAFKVLVDENAIASIQAWMDSKGTLKGQSNGKLMFVTGAVGNQLGRTILSLDLSQNLLSLSPAE